MFDWLREPGVIIGIIGIVFGITLPIVFYFKSKIVAKPQYIIENINLIDLTRHSIPNEIIMMYNSEQISTLNKTTLRFMNKGRKTIDNSDIVPSDLLIDFSTSDSSKIHIYSVDVIQKSRDVINVTTNVCVDKGVGFNFNYLDFKDYFVIEILHTSKEMPSGVIGDIKGVPKGLLNATARKQGLSDIILDSISDSAIRTMIRLIRHLY